MTKDKLAVLREHPYFLELLKELKESRPVVPDYDYKRQESGEELKALSMKRQGYDYALSILGVKNDGSSDRDGT